MASPLADTPQTSPRRSNFIESASKPVIVIVSPTQPPPSPVSETESLLSLSSSEQPLYSSSFRPSTYSSLLAKIARDAHLLTITSLETLEEALTQHGPKIAGFIIASTAILHPVHNALAMRLAALVHNNAQTVSSNSDADRIYTVLFALSFPSEAINRPLLFAIFMRNVFHLPWRLSGKTSQKVKTKLRVSVLRKLGQRVYRGRYCMRSVFLRNVKLADKVVVATGEFPIGGQRFMGLDVSRWLGDGVELLEDEYGAQTESTDEEKELEDWQSEESDVTAVGGDFGDAYSFGEAGSDTYQGDGTGNVAGPASNLVGNGVGDETMQADEDVGFLGDVEDNDAQGLDIHPIVTTTLVINNNHTHTQHADDALSDNSTIISPASLLNTSPTAVSTLATTTEASSFEGEDNDDEFGGQVFEDEDDDELTSAITLTPTTNPAFNLTHAFNPTANANTNIPMYITTDEEDISAPLHPTGWVPSDDEGTSVDVCCADSPIVIHEFKRTVAREGVEELVPSGYVGFVGHVDDSRSMSTLILGMCAVPKFVEGS
ncbi:hypothetical protein P170DRAFT_470082 [Aspergillus steynii IBT 23096]|uniref:Uncharacterized protein n=1 Tax=Aspergillus steynii IBT 23096 TaxID=1392250 RepID=A0A2I2GP28_9EURO|nr:uncharacterized protein P170DRAFT_470082 [Aspergillus steynii IBT 23096]PLB54628.1 hypothetical protein P170DRAFT_470082 [Aspergillus steynii IBT 23096]